MWNELLINIQRLPIVRDFRKKYRDFGTKRKGKNTGKKFSSTKNLSVLINLISKRIVLIGIIIFVLFTALYHFNLYLQIELDSYFPNTERKFLRDNNQMNLVLYGISETGGRAGINYYFVDHIVLVGIRNNKIGVLSINPKFIINNKEVRTYLNGDIDYDRDPVISLNEQISSIVGLRIDRYIALNQDDLKELVEFTNYKYKIGEVYEEREVVANEFNLETEINKNNLEKYLFNADLSIDSDNTTVVLGYYLKFFESKFDFLDLYNYLLHSKEASNMFKTNLSKTELSFFLRAIDSDRQVQGDTISYNESFNLGDDGIIIDSTEIDEIVSNLFRNVAVLSEQAEIEIYNATKVSGLALTKTREFQNTGSNVVKYGNYFEEADGNTLHILNETDLDRFKNTIEMISDSLDGDLEVIVGEYDFNRSGDLILILGK